MVVGAYRDNTGGVFNGAVYVQFMNSNGTVRSSTKIASGVNGGPALPLGGTFGWSVANLATWDGDGVTEIGVGCPLDGTGGPGRGAMYVSS